MYKLTGVYLILLIALFIAGCDGHPWNDPYPIKEAKANVRYNSFSSSPKTLDPARSYSTDENIFIAQIYEPPLQYAFLKRPYTLTTLTAQKMPTVTYYSSAGIKLGGNASSNQVAFTQYDIAIKPGIFYQPHPAFAKRPDGHYYYHALTPSEVKRYQQLSDFKLSHSRELVAEDYVYEIKRIALPTLNSPIYGLMATKIIGLSGYSQLLKQKKSQNGGWIDLRQYPLVGAKAIDRYHYQILIKGEYPQFLYWLAMPFFVPIPWEVDKFYDQPGMVKKNITFDWYPVGTGPYTLIENNPNRKMVLQKNPCFHPEYFPTEGEPGDVAAGYLANAGKRLPFIEKIVFTLEKESIPRWIKFLQGYYDQSAISSDSFDQAIQINSAGQPYLTSEMKQKGIYLQTSFTPGISYMGFNMLDEVVGGNSERARKLRLAISIAIDYEEYINIFLNGRGVPAQSPLPPGIFGYQDGAKGLNAYVYDWNNKPVRKPIEAARQLMKEAGYPNGVDPKTGASLILNYDLATTSGPDEKSLLAWMREQFAKIGIQLNIRNTEYNRFQEKIRQGEAQIFSWAWVADYPDPENFLFLLYGPNSKVKAGGENETNYHNANFDLLFDQMKNLTNNAARQVLINKMVAIVRHDAPWIWGVYQKDFTLNHIWEYPSKPNVMTFNTLKYRKNNYLLRNQLRQRWNKKVLWPLYILCLVFILVSLPVLYRYWQKERKSVKG